MKIAQVISTPPFAWGTGGCSRVVYELSRELAKRGHDVSILTTDQYHPDQRYKIKTNCESIDGMSILRFRNISDKLAWRYKAFISFGLIKYLIIHIKDYDLIHLQDLISVHAIATALICNKMRIPYALTAHGSLPWLNKKNLVNLVYKYLFGYMILNNASVLLALNDMEVQQLIELGINKSRIKIMPNGINVNEYENLPEKGVFRRKYSINKNEKIILYLGRIHKIKGIDLLVLTFADLVSKYNNVKLVIAGPDDGFLTSIKKQINDLKINDEVILTGPLYDSDKICAYVDADVYVLPSIYECFPLTVLEACLCGTPVIIMNNCGIAGIVNNNLGFAVERDKDKLERAIIRILTDDKLRLYLREKVRSNVKINFSYSIIAEQLENVYDSLIHSGY